MHTHLFLCSSSTTTRPSSGCSPRRRTCAATGRIGATSLAETEAALGHRNFDVALVDLGLGSRIGIRCHPPDQGAGAGGRDRRDVGHDVAQLGDRSRTSSRRSRSCRSRSTSTSCSPRSTRALERRQTNLDNRRLVWELQTINEIADGMARSLVLQRRARPARCSASSARSRSPAAPSASRTTATGLYEEQAFVGPREVPRRLARRRAAAERSGDRDARAYLRRRPPPGARRPTRRRAAGAQRVERPDDRRRRAARHVERRRRDAAPLPRARTSAWSRSSRTRSPSPCRTRGCTIRWAAGSRSGSRPSTRSAIRSPSSTATAGCCAATPRSPSTSAGRVTDAARIHLRRRSGSAADGSRLRGRPRALANDRSRTQVTLPGRADLQRHDVPGGRRRRRRVDRADREERHRGHPSRAADAADERRARGRQRRLVATIERLKSTQAQLLQAEKLSAIGQLVAGVAHELNNPLTSVIGYAQLLEEELQERATEIRPGRGTGAGPAAHRRGIRARRADRAQPARVRAPAVGRPRASRTSPTC